jgi:hypothetical protein
VRRRSIAAVITANVLMARAAAAEDACAADVTKFCGRVEASGGRISQCLRDNEASLSAACKEERAVVAARLRARVEDFATACSRDVARVCSGVRPGRGRVVACLIRQQDDLSSTCRAETERVQMAADTISGMRDTCRMDAERLCADVTEAGPLLECLQVHRSDLSPKCRAVDEQTAIAAAELIDAVDALKSAEREKEVLQVLQGLESVAFLRSQLLFQLDSYRGLARSANANRLLFNPQVVFGGRREFQVQLKVPLLAVYPYAPDHPAQTGLGAITTAFSWAFFQGARVHQYASLGLQWVSPSEPPIGSAWAVTPSYTISITLAPPIAVTGQVSWIRSFASSGFPELNLLVVEPIVAINLPGRSFLAIDSKLGCDFVDGSFLPVLKGLVGIYIDRQKSVSVSAWYQALLASEREDQPFKYGVGTGLGYFFDW